MCQHRPHGFNSLSGQIAFVRILRINNQMYMWVMGLIVKCRIPFQVGAVDFIILRKGLHPAPQQFLPLSCTVIAESLCIFPSQTDDIGPDDSLMACHFLCHFGKHHGFPRIRKQTMRADSFHSWSVCKVIYVVLFLGNNIQIVFQCLCNKFRGILPCRFLDVIVIFMHPVCIFDTVQNVLYQFFLLGGCRKQCRGVGYLFYPFTGTDVLHEIL